MYGTRGRIGLITLASDTSVLPEYTRVDAGRRRGLRGADRPAARRGHRRRAGRDARGRSARACRRAARLGGRRRHRLRLHHRQSGPRRRVGSRDCRPHRAGERACRDHDHHRGPRRAARRRRHLPCRRHAVHGRAQRDRASRSSRRAASAVASIAGLGCATDAEIGRLEPADAVSLVERVDTPEADAIFISCTNFHCLPAIASLERRSANRW